METTGHPKLAHAARTALEAFRPPPNLTLSQWAEGYRYLSPETAAMPGKWKNSQVPYLVGPMDAFTEPDTERVVMQFGAQMGKSEGLIANVVGYFCSEDPSPILIVTPREIDAKKMSRVRLTPMFRDTPCLKGVLKESRSKDAGNTILEKQTTTGARILLGGANSPANLASDPIRILLVDELDRCPASSGTEGDVVEIAETRTSTFASRKICLVSTPTEAETSRIAQAYENSDQRVYFVPCPHCDEMQTLKWGQVSWDKDEEGKHLPETAAYFCENCGGKWTEGERHEAVRKGEWRAREEFTGTAGFHLNALYAPWANLSLSKLAERFLKAKGKPLLLRAFTNLVLAETWAEKYQSVDVTGLAERVEAYPLRDGATVLPAEVVTLTAGVDTQDSRLECSVVGWGRGEEAFVVSHNVFPGSPSGPEVWADLWEFLTQPFQIEKREDEYIRSICVDSGGHMTSQAYAFTQPRHRFPTPDGRRGFCFAIKGQKGTGDIWPRRPSRPQGGKALLYPIRVAPAKEVLYARLQKIIEPGPGRIHFPDTLPDDYFKQLTAQKVITKYDARGFASRVWELKSQGTRDEALDCWVYSYAALAALQAGGFVLDREAERIDAGFGTRDAQANETQNQASPNPIANAGLAKNRTIRKNVSRSNFLRR